MTEPEEPVSRVLNGYKAAAFAKDVDAFLTLYDREVRVSDMWGRWSYDGIEAWFTSTLRRPSISRRRRSSFRRPC